jgi:hypothetical protein
VKLLELVAHDIVIVVSARVPRDGPARSAATVIHADDDRAGGPRDRQSRIPALLRGSREIVHVARVTPGHPLIKNACRLHRAQRRDSDQIEAESRGLGPDQLLE